MEYSIQDVRRTLCAMAQAGIDAKDLLTEIDSRLGDGDMGMTIEKAAAALIETVQVSDREDIGELLLGCASAMARVAPSTMGTLISCGVLSVAKSLRGRSTLSGGEIVAAAGTMAEAIRSRGKAQVGDKTVLDALVPYAKTLKTVFEESGQMDKALLAAYESAKTGMESTKGMKAKMGRARWLQDRNADAPDAGAVLCVVITGKLAGQCIADEIRELNTKN